MRVFSAAAALAGLFAAVGCSRTIVAVDRAPCADAGLITAGACIPPGLVDGLVGYWPLDDPLGSAGARDWSGSGNDGSLVDLDPNVVWPAGGPTGGSFAPGGKGHIEVKPSASIDSIATGLTVAAWMYIDTTTTDFSTAISRQVGSSIGQLYHLDISSEMLPGLFLTTTSLPNQVFIQSTSSVPRDTWVHLAGTYDGEQGRLYVDGVQVASAPQTGPFMAETNPLVISGNANAPTHEVTEAVAGRLAGVALYRRALSPDELAMLHAGVLSPEAQHPDGGVH